MFYHYICVVAVRGEGQHRKHNKLTKQLPPLDTLFFVCEM